MRPTESRAWNIVKVVKPNFIIIGAGKSGTTSIYEYLKQHPQIFMSAIKETNFFCHEEAQQRRSSAGVLGNRDLFPIQDFGQYLGLFDGVRDEIAIGEASPRYLWTPNTARRIKRELPDAKLIAILRDPAERAYSSYMMYRALGLERRTFKRAIHDEEAGLHRDLASGQWHYVGFGFYFRQLSRYFERFDRSQIGIYFFEDLVRDASSLVGQVFRFLGVDRQFCPDTSVKFNPSGVPKNRIVHWMMRKRPAITAVKNRLPDWIRRRANAQVVAVHRRNLAKPPLPDELREHLTSSYREDIENLVQLLQCDLSHWIRPVIPPAEEGANG